MTDLEAIRCIDTQAILRICTRRDLVALFSIIDKNQLLDTVVQNQNALDGFVVDLGRSNKSQREDYYSDGAQDGAEAAIRFALLIIKRTSIVCKHWNIPNS